MQSLENAVKTEFMYGKIGSEEVEELDGGA
jgi:hypothetical protein